MKKLFGVLVILSVLFTDVFAEEKLFLMPKDSSEAISYMKQYIKSAKVKIYAAAYSFTREDIAKELKNAAKRGVEVVVIFDEQTNRKKKKGIFKKLAVFKNVNVYLLRGKRSNNGKYFGKQHQKLMIVDGKRSMFGSANWSYSAFSLNYENLYFTDDKKITAQFVRHFEKELLPNAKRYE